MVRRTKTIKELREARGLTQAEIADKYGISIATQNRAERKNKWPTFRLTRDAYAKAFGIFIPSHTPNKKA